jgi:hypothetical protein
MKRLSIISMCLLLLGAFAATMAASASATETPPEIWECHKLTKGKVSKKYEGEYEKGCKAKNSKKEGEYEFQPFANTKPKAFKGKGGPANLSIENVSTVSCSKSADTGHFSGPKTAADILVTFTKCETAGLKCENTATEGEVKTNPLKAEIGFFDESKGKKVAQEVGTDLKAESGEYEAELHCGSVAPTLNLRVKGSVIGEVVPGVKSGYNKFSKEQTLDFEEIGGKQAIQSFEGGLKDTLITETCKGCEPTKPEDNSAESTESVGKGEELYLKTV